MTQRNPSNALGLLSMVLGTISLLLFFLPILGLPISAFSLLFGIMGLLVTFGQGGLPLRRSLQGCALSTLALTFNLSITYAPSGYLTDPIVQPPWQPVPNRPYVSPRRVRGCDAKSYA